MQLGGYRSPDDYMYYIYLDCMILPSFNTIPVNFLIDTGCTATTLSYTDFLKFGIDLNQFEYLENEIYTANGKIKVKKICPCTLWWRRHDFSLFEVLKEILVKPENLCDNFVSLLGLDFLKRFTIKFDNDVVFLEK